MLCFLIPLKSAAVANDWERVCNIFEATLRSAYHQTDPDFRILVICHEKPILKGVYNRLDLVGA